MNLSFTPFHDLFKALFEKMYYSTIDSTHKFAIKPWMTMKTNEKKKQKRRSNRQMHNLGFGLNCNITMRTYLTYCIYGHFVCIIFWSLYLYTILVVWFFFFCPLAGGDTHHIVDHRVPGSGCVYIYLHVFHVIFGLVSKSDTHRVCVRVCRAWFG